jgi:ribosome biogenesis GTPase
MTVATQHALVITATRRSVQLLTEDGQTLKGRVSTHARDITVGDTVAFSIDRGEAFITKVLSARNYLTRAYQEKKKKLAANLDRVFIVTATAPLFNEIFVDRIIAVATREEIPCTLIVNKTDLDLESTLPLVKTYEHLGIPVLYTSAKLGEGMAAVEEAVRDPSLRIVALAGVSGVGKSSILNNLIPEAESRTAEVSHRTGQGRQTTSQSRGYTLHREGAPPLLIIDLPGIQKFGVTHLTKREAADAFVEFRERARECRFGDCSHTAEEECGVQDAVDSGAIALSRYVSYLDMIEEIESAREY